ncbi:hypothetical protein D3C81_1109530 [compost metagenome]
MRLQQRVQADGLLQAERPGLGAAQFGDVRSAAQRLAEILDQSANVGALAAGYRQIGKRRLETGQLKTFNSNRTRLALHYLAGTRQLVQRLAIALERRVHRRYLLDWPPKARQQRLQLFPTNGHFTLLEHLTLGIAGGGGDAQVHDRGIAFLGIQQVLGELGRLAEAQRQHAGRQRIEAAGMPGLLGIEQPAHLLQRGVGTEAVRLVEDQDAADRAADSFHLGHALLLACFRVVVLVTILGHRTLDQRRQMGAAAHALVVEEMQLRHGTQLERASEQHAQVTGGILENALVEGDLLIVVVLPHDGEEHLGMGQIAADFGAGQGHQTQARILDLALDQLRQLALHLVTDTLGTAVFFGHDIYP